MAVFNSSNPNLNGNNSMGYGLMLFFLAIGFAISSLILTVLIRSKGGFDWVSSETGIRTTLVFMACLLVALTTFFCLIFKWEWHDNTMYPQFLHWLAVGYGQLWIPLMWLVACFLSINPNWQSSVPLQALKIPFWVGLSVSVLFSGGLLVGYVRDSARSAETEMATRIDDEKRWHQQHLDQIAAHKAEDSILGLLAFSTPYQADDVRQAALDKIKAHPDWEAQLLELLTNKYYYREVYSFLGSNPVAHPEAFIQPLNQSIVQLSTDIKTYIKEGDNLQDWSFDSYGITYLLRAISGQFGGQIVTFYPNVIKLKQALNTPPSERDKGIRFPETAQVERWLAEHKK